MEDQEKVKVHFCNSPGALAAINDFPKPGTKLRYRETNKYWHVNIIENAQRELQVGEIYTLRTIEIGRSWTIITLEETGDTEYSLGFFEKLSESEPNT
jgi:hypothetical protein